MTDPAGELRLAKRTWPEARELFGPDLVALVPIGSTEPHGPHLPLDVDVTIAEAQARTIAAELEEQGGPPAEETWDSQAVALIGYLQRLGTDYLNKDAAPAEEGGE